MADQAIGGASTDEENYVVNKLKDIGEFLTNMKEKEGKLSPKVKGHLDKFTSEWIKTYDRKIKNLDDKLDYDTQGARPKQKVAKKHKVKSESETSNSSPVNTDTSDDQIKSSATIMSKSSVSIESKASSTKRKKKSDIGMLVDVMKKLDARKVPAQEIFDEDSGQDLRKYLIKFEKYCVNNFRGDRDLWIGELERHLEGKTREALRAMKDSNTSYEELKQKLLDWYDNLKELRRKKNKEKLSKIKYVTGESTFLYSTRLENLYKLCFPNKKINESKSLREKFVATVPKKFRSILSSTILAHKLSDKKITWKMIQKCARHYDLEKEKEQGVSEEEKSEVKEIEININKHHTNDSAGMNERKNGRSPIRTFFNSGNRRLNGLQTIH